MKACIIYRDFFYDNAKTILIFLVVLGHALEGVPMRAAALIYKFVYLFYMPCFVYILGHFSRNTGKERIIYNFFLYLSFQTAYGAFNIFALGQPRQSFNYITPIWILWFILAAPVWQLVFYKLKDNNKKYFIVIASFVAGLLVGYINFIGYTLSLSRIIVFAPFFLLGFYRSKDLFRPIKKFHIILASACAICIFIIVAVFNPFDSRFLYGSVSYEKLNLMQWRGFVCRLFFYAASLALSACVLILMPRRKRWFTVFGSRTLQVYFFHGFIIICAKRVGLPSYITSYASLFLYMLFVAVLVAALSLKIVKDVFDKLCLPLKGWAAGAGSKFFD